MARNGNSKKKSPSQGAKKSGKSPSSKKAAYHFGSLKRVKISSIAVYAAQV